MEIEPTWGTNTLSRLSSLAATQYTYSWLLIRVMLSKTQPLSLGSFESSVSNMSFSFFKYYRKCVPATFQKKQREDL